MTDQLEMWKPICGYEGFYEVSNLGRVRRMGGLVVRTIKGTTFEQRQPEKILSPSHTARQRYPLVSLSKNGTVEKTYVHTLVAEHFIGPRPEGMQICHGPKGSSDASVLNLRYDSPKGNASDRDVQGTGCKGERNSRAVLSEDLALHVKDRLSSLSIKEVALETGINYSTVRSIKSGKNWSHLQNQPPVAV
jgi:hypothetical protein